MPDAFRDTERLLWRQPRLDQPLAPATGSSRARLKFRGGWVLEFPAASLLAGFEGREIEVAGGGVRYQVRVRSKLAGPN